jgi:hypothetical protein
MVGSLSIIAVVAPQKNLKDLLRYLKSQVGWFNINDYNLHLHVRADYDAILSGRASRSEREDCDLSCFHCHRMEFLCSELRGP